MEIKEVELLTPKDFTNEINKYKELIKEKEKIEEEIEQIKSQILDWLIENDRKFIIVEDMRIEQKTRVKIEHKEEEINKVKNLVKKF